ncbi:MAG: hypothetical protein QM237_01395 [Bacteroidota bacterium]|jgi:hypothetical protein|nr:hypothetical protein [Bacteroidota bacterium]HHU96445.1 hypothetical protein [Petrimonas sp.]
MDTTYKKGTFGYDVHYLSGKDPDLIVLKSKDEKAQLILSSKYQAKVFTSTVNGLGGNSHGFVNYRFFDSGLVDEHINGFGGENRFWLGPEGGQYSIYFEPGSEQKFNNWYVPKPIDTESWETEKITDNETVFIKEMSLPNYLGNRLHLKAKRKVTLLENEQVEKSLHVSLPEGVQVMGYSTENSVTNLNDFEWTEKTGTVCIWMLDMYPPSEKAVTVIPYNKGCESALGVVVTSDYFGEIPVNRLVDKEGVLYFKTDGKSRGKLGLNAKRTTGVAGNYNPLTRCLTIITFDVHPEATYLNQEWNPGRNPLIGDLLNAYNDGPLEDGSIMGPFYELESSSPAAFLKPGETLTHKHDVYHFVGDQEELTLLSQALLGIDLKKVVSVFQV